MSDFDLLMQNMSQTTGMLGQRAEDAATPAWNIKTETGPEGQALATIKMPMKDALGIQQKMTYLEQALQAMTQEANRLQAQEQRTRQHPLIAALSTVAGELAQDKRLPPAVSALGRASLALNPPPDVLGARRMGLEEQIGRTSALGAEVGMRGVEMNISQKREARLEEAAKAEQAATTERLKEQRQRDHVAFMTKEFDRARLTQNYTAEDKAAFIAAGMEAFPGSRKEEWEAAAERAQRLAIESKVAQSEKEKAAEKADVRKADLQLRNRMAQIKAETGKALLLQQKRFEEQQRKSHENIPAKFRENVVMLDVVSNNSKELRRMATEHPEYFGIAGHARLVAESLFDTQASEVLAMKEHLFAQLAKAYGGARGFAKVEQPIFRALAGGKFQDSEATLGTLDTLDKWVEFNRTSISKQFPSLVAPAGTPAPAAVPGAPTPKRKVFVPGKGVVEQ